ncbi:beta-lactamase-like protein [Dactylonectria macrodidyma]|uniref:Beta-lactamase-like protein n=1 Tax=Dactylonectria macrodidyma TaxID=307937 RepID=A0A9P9FRT1_9HYPO|nr:beta-lactamase-like protein [Dactylonectria macrodidyma]
MSSQLIPANPSDVMSIRNVTPNVVTFSVPFARFGRIKIGGRGTLVRLTSGALAVFSPVALTDTVKANVAELGGDVRYIVALDFEHHIFISEWAKEYPAAKIIGPEGLPEKRAKQQDDPKIGNEEFSVIFTKEKKRETHISDEFDADFEYEYVNAHANLELVFFYKPDRVLIEADLLFNLPATEQYSKVPAADKPADGFLGRLFAGVQDIQGDARWIKRVNWYAVKDRESFNESMRRIDQWDFTTLIPCHGDVIEGDAKQTFQKVFEWHLKGTKH